MLPRPRRVTRQADFDRIFQTGRTQRGQLLTVRTLAVKEPSRFAVVAGRRVSAKATFRNRLKRQVRAALRELVSAEETGRLVVVQVQPAALGQEYPALRDELAKLLKP